MSKSKAIIVSGYFNPIHKGPLEYFNKAKAQPDKFFKIVNKDHQRALKETREFKDESERIILVSNIKSFYMAIFSIYTYRMVCETIKFIAKEFGFQYDLSFANGEDQNNDTIPERDICEEINLALIDGLGVKFSQVVGYFRNCKVYSTLGI